MYARALTRTALLGIVVAAVQSCGPGGGDKESPAAALDGLIAAERAFAQRSVEAGMRQAFLDFLAEDSVLFLPAPLPGREAMTNRPEPNGQLSWAPGFADVSAAGDLGYTTGPYRFSTRLADGTFGEPYGYGHFVSVWQRQADGSWKVLLDIGIDHANPGPFPGKVATPPIGAAKPIEGDAAAEREALLELDRSMSDPRVYGEALMENAADGLRFYQFGFIPFVGKAAAREALSESDVRVVWDPEASGVSRSLDLGYSYGFGNLVADDMPSGMRISYLRIWRRRDGGPWQVVVDIALPAPEQPS